MKVRRDYLPSVKKLFNSLPRSPLAAGLLGISICGHLFCMRVIRLRVEPSGFPYILEAQVLILLSLLTACCGFLFEKRFNFLVVHGIRLALILITASMLRVREAALVLVMLNLFVIDTALFEPFRSAVAIIVAGVAAYCLAAFFTVSDFSGTEFLLHAGLTVLSTAMTGTGFLVVTGYREKAVVDNRTIRDLNNAFEKLTSSNLGLQTYAAEAENQSAEKERNRVTRELHDSVGYAMTNIAMTMNASKVLLKTGNMEKLSDMLEHTRDVANKCLQETRSTLYRLRSIQEKEQTGLDRLSHLQRVYSDATGIPIALEYGNTVKSYGREIDMAVYRFAQEAITNAFRHSKAENIRLRILLHQDGNKLVVRVWDNGRGIQDFKEGIGLKGMRERIGELNGKIQYSNLADGFEIWAVLPFTDEP